MRKWIRWLDEFCVPVIIIALFLGVVGSAILLTWKMAGKEAEVYNQLTGKHVTQRDMFYGSEMFKILPSDIMGRIMDHPFTDEELLVIFEALSLCFNDNSVFDDVGDAVDIKDNALYNIDVKIRKFLNPDYQEGE